MMEMDVYKSSRAAAESAAESVRKGLLALGVPDHEVEGIRSVVLGSGRPLVFMGTWRLDIVEKISAGLRLVAAAAETKSRKT